MTTTILTEVEWRHLPEASTLLLQTERFLPDLEPAFLLPDQVCLATEHIIDQPLQQEVVIIPTLEQQVLLTTDRLALATTTQEVQVHHTIDRHHHHLTDRQRHPDQALEVASAHQAEALQAVAE